MENSTKKVNLYLISDATGETLKVISRSVMDRFSGVKCSEHLFSMVRAKPQVDKIISNIVRPALVIYTIVDEDLRRHLNIECRKQGIECMSALSHIVSRISSVFNLSTNDHVGRRYKLDEEYFSRMDAINFAISHDDGNSIENLEEADIVLTGVSRTSKSPTCIFLAYRGFKAANVPFVMNSQYTDILTTLKKPVVVGLTVSPERLIDIRRNRMISVQNNVKNSYTDFELVEQELLEARKFFARNFWPQIDVTQKSVEETAAKIIQIYNERYDNI